MSLEDEGKGELWQLLEKRVRTIAGYLWDRPAEPKKINGVNVDCVVEIEPGRWACVEISVSNTLEKIRTDLAKFQTIRPYLFSQGIFASCYFVTTDRPPPSVLESAEGFSVTALSVDDFASKFFDFARYAYVRKQKAFGSAVKPDSGEIDVASYVPVKYRKRDGQEISLGELAALVAIGKKVVLLGEFGTGKSRCIKEIFSELEAHAIGAGQYPIAINLRENWGVRRATELIRRHFDDLGLSDLADRLVKVFDRGGVVFLLDGFDEIGSQAWGDSQSRLRQIRQESVRAIKELLQAVKGGAIISGREHYFNGEEELFTALGLETRNTEVVRCSSEFTDAEMKAFLARLPREVVLPAWLPRRPLICQIIAGLNEAELDEMFEAEGGGAAFWNRMMDVICAREARISMILEAEYVKNVLRLIARTTRTKGADVGPVSIAEINRAFEKAVGSPPVDESAVMLQRLPGLGLGRPVAESTDRQFIDKYILDGLRALDVVHCINNRQEEVEKEPWANPLQELGQSIVAYWIDGDQAREGVCDAAVRLARRCANAGNQVMAADVVASLVRCQRVGDAVDFGALHILSAQMGPVDWSRTVAHNLTLEECVLEELVIPAIEPKGTRLLKCHVGIVRRIASAAALPPWVERCSADKFDGVTNVAQIRAALLSPVQQALVAMIKKTFFQPGSGRKEEALLRGLGREVDSGMANKILNLLIREGILERARGEEGALYVPKRSQTKRMRLMLSELATSKDEVWQRVSELN